MKKVYVLFPKEGKPGKYVAISMPFDRFMVYLKACAQGGPVDTYGQYVETARRSVKVATAAAWASFAAKQAAYVFLRD